MKYVKDAVDGDLIYSDKEIKKSGYYIDKGKLDTKKTGTYEIKVLAYDANGNATEKSFKVIVKKKEVAKPENNSSQPSGAEKSNGTGQQAQTTSPSSSQGSSSSGEQNNAQPSGESSGSSGDQTNKPTSKPQTCTLAAGQVGNSGLTFKTYAEAEAWGAKEQESSDSIVSYTPMEMYDTCDNVVGYTLSYSYAK